MSKASSYFLITTFFLSFSMSFAQEKDPVRQAQEYVDEADRIYRYQKEAIEVAKELYIKATEIDPSNVKAHWMAGKLYTETVDRDKSVDYFLAVQQLDPKYRFDILYHIGRGYHYGLDFEGAKNYYEMYKEKMQSNSTYRGKDRIVEARVDRRIHECENGLQVISQPTQYSIEILGEAINSPFPDYAPVLNKNEDVMIFTSRREEGNVSDDVDEDNFYYEDIYVSRKKGGVWSKAENIGVPVNMPGHDQSVSLSEDGNQLYIYRRDGKGDIFQADFDGVNWSTPKPFTKKINSSIYSEHSVAETSSPKVILYTSNRPGGQGGFDIYMIGQNSKGEWYKSKTLGPVINTKYDEDNPYLAPDGKTLYFSSAGHKGYGGYDIFRSVYDSLRERWSEPENLGYPVNTPDDELYFQASEDGRRGYLASIREGGMGFSDIFMVKYHGAAVGSNSGELLAAARKRKEGLRAGSGLGSMESQTEDEKQEGLEYEEEESELMGISHRIFFNARQSAIQDKHQEELDKIIELINKYEVLNIDIAGFASADGNPRYNLELSHQRAMIVLNYFVGRGVPEERIVARGFGSIKGTEGLSDESRRAEVRIISESK